MLVLARLWRSGPGLQQLLPELELGQAALRGLRIVAVWYLG